MAEFHIIEGNDADMAREIKSSLFDAFDAIEEVDCSTGGIRVVPVAPCISLNTVCP